MTGTGTLGLNFVSPVALQPVDAYGNVTSGTFTGGVYTVDPHATDGRVDQHAAAGDTPTSCQRSIHRHVLQAGHGASTPAISRS